MKKIVIGCGLFLVIGFCFMCLMFYTLTLPKYRDSSKDKPFSTIVNKKLITKKPVLIIINPDTFKDENYKFHLEDGSSYGMDTELEVITKLPIGTEVTIDKVELHTGRVSGSTSAYLFGKVYSEEMQKSYNFEYTWGNYHFLYEDKPYWTFKIAFWQDEPLTERYFIDIP
ncbi:hypothetical protein [Tenacibaculum aquimarinum]|uniref:hypothetical protein n=1 Tax=Tenacibaculum aquimarinum TaxID=2910675 RepID=UPI001F0AC8B1|nr:hypothetical protein [Tenacibaculum aquimarinum]MCH3884959.1 hypothetical protein [Tenacibaculum aquimarinum]